MSPSRCQSPRAAIREWLAHTDQGPPIRSKRNQESQKPEREGRSKRQRSPHHHYGEALNPSRKAGEARHDPEDRHHQRARRELDDFPDNHRDGRNLADQLGLHAPFRSFATRGTDVAPEVQRNVVRSKRRRSPSVTSSYLEPATCFRQDKIKKTGHEATAENARRHRNQHSGSITSSRSSSATVPSPEKPMKSYERRSRRKTREDRYELKHGKKRAKPKDGEKLPLGKSKRKRKRMEKSGAALMHNFSANNVEPERLTLKSTVPLGLFGRGRASSPVRRRGLPDLTFSEMNFLNHRKAGPQENIQYQDKRIRRNKDRAADAEAEISRFFASSKDQDRQHGGTRRHRESDQRKSKRARTRRKSHDLYLPPVDLPERPFLGFGSCGPGHISPVASVSGIDNQLSPPRRSLSNRSTTCYTWSQTQLSRHSPSRHLSRFSRLSSESRAKPHPQLGRSARRHARSLSARVERNFQEKAHTSPAAQDDEDESHDLMKSNPSVPADIASCSLSRPVKENSQEINSMEQKVEGSKTNRRGDLQSRPGSSSGAALASSLATQSRSELLGALLDTLLSRVKRDHSEACQDLGPSRVPDSKGQNQVSTSKTDPETQMLHKNSDPHTQNLLLPEFTASSCQINGTQQPQPLHAASSKVGDPLHPGVSRMQFPPEPIKGSFRT
ncbi:MAG: hypothetical protein Q9225_007546, partial [Loekoesia sp. 1 TL-2023]